MFHPSHENTVVWRYMSFASFVAMITKRELFFRRPCKFDDRWEGLYPPCFEQRTMEYFKSIDEPEGAIADWKRNFLRVQQGSRCGSFVNCWHAQEHESDAMWRLYGSSKESVAIRSTIGKIMECLVPSPDSFGDVQYYAPDDLTFKSLRSGFFKRNHFEHEHEVRFWYEDRAVRARIANDEVIRDDNLSKGEAHAISDPPKMIQKIVVAPGAEDWFFDAVKRVSGSLSPCVRRSLMDSIHSASLPVK
jgi:hypothetical protein